MLTHFYEGLFVILLHFHEGLFFVTGMRLRCKKVTLMLLPCCKKTVASSAEVTCTDVLAFVANLRGNCHISLWQMSKRFATNAAQLFGICQNIGEAKLQRKRIKVIAVTKQCLHNEKAKWSQHFIVVAASPLHPFPSAMVLLEGQSGDASPTNKCCNHFDAFALAKLLHRLIGVVRLTWLSCCVPICNLCRFRQVYACESLISLAFVWRGHQKDVILPLDKQTVRL